MKTSFRYTCVLSLLFMVSAVIAQTNSGQVTLINSELTYNNPPAYSDGYEMHIKSIEVTLNTPIILNFSNNTSNSLYIFTNANLSNPIIISSTNETGTVTLSSPDGEIFLVSLYEGGYFDFQDEFFCLYTVNYSPRYSSDVSSYTGKLGVGIQNPVNRFEIWDGVDARFVFSGTNVTSGYATAHELNDKGYKITVASSTKDFRIALDGFDEFKIQPKSNFSLGRASLHNLTTGQRNTAIGFGSLGSLTTGSHNLAIGSHSLELMTTGSGNIGIGENAGKWFEPWVANTSASNSIFIGNNTRSKNANDINQIVIGDWATGAGSNSVTIGNNGIVSTILKGNIGIGIANPQYKIDVEGTANINGNVRIIGSTNVFSLQTHSSYSVHKNNVQTLVPTTFQMPHYGIAAPLAGDGAELWLSGRNGVRFFTNLSSMPTLNISKEGNVGIGTTSIPSEYKLAVAGKIIAEEVMIMLRSQWQWPDYVFDYDYPLMPIAEVESFVRRNNHLPGIPTAETVSEEGVSLGEMQRLLLQKVEELTLYIIQQDKEIKQLKDDLSAIKSGN